MVRDVILTVNTCSRSVRVTLARERTKMTCLIADYEQMAPTRGAIVASVDVSPGQWDAVRADYGLPADAPLLLPLDGPVPVVVDRPALEGLPAPPRYVRPLDGPRGSGLFRTFATTELTDDVVAEFFATNGRLGVPAVTGTLPNGREIRGELINAWHGVQQDMRWPLRIWDALRAGTVPKSLADKSPEFVRELLNTLVSGELGRPNAVKVVLDKTTERPNAVQLRPATLAGALWLQFALAIDGDRDYRSCVTCGRFYELDPAVARTNRIYCMDACRMRAYRQRKGRRN
jgi:hypothetical protein